MLILWMRSICLQACSFRRFVTVGDLSVGTANNAFSSYRCGETVNIQRLEAKPLGATLASRPQASAAEMLYKVEWRVESALHALESLVSTGKPGWKLIHRGKTETVRRRGFTNGAATAMRGLAAIQIGLHRQAVGIRLVSDQGTAASGGCTRILEIGERAQPPTLRECSYSALIRDIGALNLPGMCMSA